MRMYSTCRSLLNIAMVVLLTVHWQSLAVKLYTCSAACKQRRIGSLRCMNWFKPGICSADTHRPVCDGKFW